jgi:hypothetical protein
MFDHLYAPLLSGISQGSGRCGLRGFVLWGMRPLTVSEAVASATRAEARDLRCLRQGLLYPPVLRGATQVAAVVGTVLFIINQLDVVVSRKITLLTLLKIALTYLAPFSISTYSALQISRIPPAEHGV